MEENGGVKSHREIINRKKKQNSYFISTFIVNIKGKKKK